MPLYNITVDDASPLWTYTGNWSDTSIPSIGGPSTDSAFTQYGASSYHATNQTGADASITFNGSAIYIFGAQRPTYGACSFSVDGTQLVVENVGGSDEFQIPWFSRGVTTLGASHTASVQDSRSESFSNGFDVDFAVITLGDNDDTTTHSDTQLDDTSSNVTYSAGWDTTPNDLISSYFNQTYHVTSEPGAMAVLNFYGNHVEVYGATSTNHRDFTVSLDGAPPVTYSGMGATFRAQQLLAMYSGLPLGMHTLTIVNAGVSGADFLDVDRFVVSTWDSPSSAATPPISSTSSSAPSASGNGHQQCPSCEPQGGQQQQQQQVLSTGAIGGIAAGGATVLLLCGLALVLCMRRGARQREAIRRKAAAGRESFLAAPRGSPSPHAMRVHDATLAPDQSPYIPQAQEYAPPLAARATIAAFRPNMSASPLRYPSLLSSPQPTSTSVNKPLVPNRLGQLSPPSRDDFSPPSAGASDESFALLVRQPSVDHLLGRPDSHPPPIYSEAGAAGSSTRPMPRPPRPWPVKF